MQPSLYFVLGVSPDANLSQIRRAYRDKARQCHPDHDPQGHERFVQLNDAYHVLTNPSERARYDRIHARRRPEPPRRRKVDVVADFETHSPSLEEITELFARNFPRRRQTKVTHARQLSVELLITPQEAAAGTRVQLVVPVFRPCSICSGVGRTGFAICDHCVGAGSEQMSASVDVLIPPNTPDGATIPVSLSGIGVRSVYLEVYVRVTD